MIAALLSGGKGADFWDRPEGDWGRPQARLAAELDRRRHANSCYRLGSTALRAGDLELAQNWLRRAVDERHPGAAFRLAVALWRSGRDSVCEAVAVLVSAARWGHADARDLLHHAGWDLADIGLGRHQDIAVPQDSEFTADIEALLGAARHSGESILSVRIPQPRNTGAAGRTAAAVVGEAKAVPAVTAGPSGEPDGRGQGARSERAAVAPGRSVRWAVGPLRHASLTHLAQQVPVGGRPSLRWQSAQRVLELLQTIAQAGRPVGERHLAQTNSLSRLVVQRLLVWLGQQQMVQTTPDGGWVTGPALRMLAAPGRQQGAVIRQVLATLRDAVGAAVYIGSYRGGEVKIMHWADGPSTPAVRAVAPFEEAAHATALGKSLLAQLNFEQRMDHLARYQPVMLTQRTITDRAALFDNLDGHGPQAAQFDLLEYSPSEVCFAVPLQTGDDIGCVALSLPAVQRHRLLQAAKILSSRSAGLLLSLLLAATPPTLETGRTDALLSPRSRAGRRGHTDLATRDTPGPDTLRGQTSPPEDELTVLGVMDEGEERDAKVIPFPLRTVDPPPVHSPDVLYSTSLDLWPHAAAGGRP
ncbi:IclR family transcriptional regulator domain-containing protein [Streptomyces sp. NPDC004050]